MRYIPTTFIRKAITQAAHVVTDSGPFPSTDDTNVLDRKYSKEEIFVGSVTPILVHLDATYLVDNL